ncbi:MAG: formate/nitrite transporter family protein [Steroidobacteraceae bacterium]|nr:formate/nitrite transporter family protein [Steroidobacteraceae bacterium]
MPVSRPKRDIDPDSAIREQLLRDEPEKEAQKSYHTVLEQHVEQAAEEYLRPAGGLLLSSFSAGMDIGFGPFVMAVIATLAAGELPRSVTDLLVALAYTTGFVFVVIGRSALFTEQTTSAVLPVLSRRASVADLLRVWGIVLAGNLAGTVIAAAFIGYVAPRHGIVQVSALAAIASKLLAHPWWIILFSAIAAGWLMGLLAWLVVAARDTISQIAIVVMTTFVIGIAGLHHSIAGAVEVLMAVVAHAGPTLGDFGRFLLAAVVGNAIGGTVFVALLKYGHVRARRFNAV